MYIEFSMAKPQGSMSVNTVEKINSFLITEMSSSQHLCVVIQRVNFMLAATS